MSNVTHIVQAAIDAATPAADRDALARFKAAQAMRPTYEELLALLKQTPRFLQLDKGRANIEAQYAADQDALAAKVRAALMMAEFPTR